jgi:hypothetical protein
MWAGAPASAVVLLSARADDAIQHAPWLFGTALALLMGAAGAGAEQNQSSAAKAATGRFFISSSSGEPLDARYLHSG